jgi:hypothetical protein
MCIGTERSRTQAKSIKSIVDDVALPHFILSVWEFSKNVFPEQWIRQGGPTVGPVPSVKLNLLLSLGSSKVYCFWFRIRWLPGTSTMNTEWILDDSNDNWNLPASQVVTVQTSNAHLWSSRWKRWAFPLIFRML